MEWIKNGKPEESGIYLIMLNIEISVGKSKGFYAAYFDSKNNQWYKYDIFDFGNERKDIINKDWVIAFGKSASGEFIPF